MAFASIARLGCCLAAVAMGLSACSSSGNAVSKVKIFRLDASKRLRAADPAIAFEYRTRLHGALTAEEVAAREGNYYTAFWSVEGRSPVTVVFEYRQASSGPKTTAIEYVVEAPRSSNVTEFSVLGPTLKDKGRIVAWRITLRRGRQILASRQSYLWE